MSRLLEVGEGVMVMLVFTWLSGHDVVAWQWWAFLVAWSLIAAGRRCVAAGSRPSGAPMTAAKVAALAGGGVGLLVVGVLMLTVVAGSLVVLGLGIGLVMRAACWVSGCP